MSKLIITSSSARDDEAPVEIEVGWLEDAHHVSIGTVLVGGGLIGRDGERIDPNLRQGWFATLSESVLDELIESLIHARRKSFGPKKQTRSTRGTV